MQVKAGFFPLLLIIMLLACINPVIGLEKAPEFTLFDINGTEFSLSDYRGKVVLIDLFRMNPSCPPCLYAIPHLKGVYNRYSRSDIIMMSISVSSLDTNDTLRSDFVEEYDIPWIVACGGTEIASKYSVSAVPTLVVVDAEGDINYRHEGVTEESTLISEIDSFFITILSPKNEQYTASFVPLNFVINKAASWIGYSLDGRENVTINGNTNLTDLADGTHDVVVYFKEESGNKIYSNKVSFSIETATQQVGPPYMLIAIIVGIVIVSLFIGIVVAGQLLGWSEPSKKRHKRSHNR
jgi:thiol-disulfide isomerase/thioredoxin